MVTTRTGYLVRCGRVDLDSAVAFADGEVREGRQRSGELVPHDVASEGERGAVARTVEAVRGRVVAQYAAQVGAHAGERSEASAVFDHEADGR